MKYIAIVREGDNDEISLEGLKEPVYLRYENPNFVRWRKNTCTIVFVGTYTIRRKNDYIVIYSMPKYYPKENCNKNNLNEIKNHIKKICCVVEKLRAEGKSFDDEEYLFNPYEQGVTKQAVNRVELAEYIIEDYIQYGLYVKDLTETVKGGRGRTSWAKTVRKVSPIIQNNSPIYLELMNKRHIIDENDLLSVIHANVVNQCLEFMGTLILDGIQYIETESLGGDLSPFATTINTYSTYIFKEREINLFKALEAWCSLTQYYEKYAGVTCFDRVWEWTNDAVWGNIDHPESSHPSYHIGKYQYFGKGEAIPDTIRIEESDREESCDIYIFDSKYYTINYTSSKWGNYQIDGFPANSDIVKQVAYLKLISSQYKLRNCYNAFLLPEATENCDENEKELFSVSDKEWFKTIGFVKPGSFNLQIPSADNNSGNEEKVGIIIVNPDKLYDRYLSGYHTKHEELCSTCEYLSIT